MSSPRRRVGLLFGSFNPIHTGHLILANFMATNTDLDEVWLIVSPQSPFKVGEELLPEAERLALVQLAITGNEHLKVLNVEFSLPKPNYTIDTLDELRRQHPEAAFVLLMGGDNLPGLPRWKSVERLLTEFAIYVYPRPGYALGEVTEPNIRLVQAPLLDISATFIRNSIREGKSIRYLLPDAVEQEIRTKGYWK
jgi:nicotinate-nucleotide adenylyltransferase